MDYPQIWQTVSEIVTRYQLLEFFGVDPLPETLYAIAAT
jgi:hypothetical protein